MKRMRNPSSHKPRSISVLSKAGIRRRYPDEWVLLTDPELDRHKSVIGGTLVCHSKDRDEVYDKAMELGLRRAATFYTGVSPAEGEEILL